FSSTTKLGAPLLQFTLPLFKVPGPATPGLTLLPPATEVIAPTVPVPPSVPPLRLTALVGCALLTSNVPALTVVVPEQVFAPLKVSVPVPVFVSATVPVPFWMRPEN